MDFKVTRNDITNMAVDAIVLPANPRLREGPGTSTAIFRGAGREQLQKACRQYGKVPVGTAVPTSAYELPSKIILHTVVPAWKGGKKDEWKLLSAAYLSALAMADQTSCESVAFPLLSSGNNGFDTNLAISIAIESIKKYEPSHKLRDVYIVTYGSGATKAMRDRGYQVNEVIDERYVLENDESYHAAMRPGKKDGAKGAQAFADKAVDEARKFWKNRKNRELVLDVAAQIVSIVVFKNTTPKGKAVAVVTAVAKKAVDEVSKK